MDKVKAVRIMCDWCADGVWPAPSVPNSSMAAFSVSDALWQRLQAWQAGYHEQDRCRDIGDWGSFDITGFVTESREIAKAVKRELPDWIVIYHDEANAAEAMLRGLSRRHYETVIR